MTYPNPHPRRLLAAAAIATLLGVAALCSLSTAPASAAYGRCEAGEFCLYWNASATPSGGLYHYSGSDSTLLNDRYEVNHTNTIVANSSASAWVNGYAAAKDDVIVYRSTGWPNKPGQGTCLRRGDKGMLPIEGWWNDIESYKWATDSECRAVGVTDLK
jgi:hypothetical protein